MPDKLTIATQCRGIVPVDVTKEDVVARIAKNTEGWGVDKVFECSGADAAFGPLAQWARPGGCITLVGMPSEPVEIDIVGWQARELRIETVIRYVNIFNRAIALIASGKIDMTP